MARRLGLLILLLVGACALAAPAHASIGTVIRVCPDIASGTGPAPTDCVSMSAALAQAEGDSGPDTLELENGEYCPVNLQSTGELVIEGLGSQQILTGSGGITTFGNTALLTVIGQFPQCFSTGYSLANGPNSSEVFIKNLTLGTGTEGISGTQFLGDYDDTELSHVVIRSGAIGIREGGPTSLRLEESTVEGARTGIDIEGGSLDSVNNTISGNSEDGITGANYDIFSRNDTITGNGAGIDARCCGNQFHITNDLVARNTTADCSAVNDLIDGGNNVVGDNSCNLVNGTNHDTVGYGGALGGPADNGGATPTIRPPSDTAVTEGGSNCPGYDQRDERRQNVCAVGSYQGGADVSDPALFPSPLDFGTLYQGDSATTRSVLVENDGDGALVVESASVSGAGFSLAGNGCTDELFPGDSCSVQVSASTANTGSLSGSVTVQTNGGPVSAALTAAVTADRPAQNVSPPFITGDAIVGSTLTAHDGTWKGSDPIAFTYQWQQCTPDPEEGEDCEDIDQATDTTYVPVEDDVGDTLAVVVTGTNDFGSDTVESDDTDAVTEGGGGGGGPANDDFANATPISGAGGSADGDNDGATRETGEPHNVGGDSASVWYAWTAPAGGTYSFDDCGAAFDSTVGVYTGTGVDDLTQITADDDDPSGTCGTASRVSLDATAGTVYYVSVASLSAGETGTFTLEWSQAAPPTVTLTTPTDGAILADDTPTFAGTADTSAFDAADVSVDVYAGTDTADAPVDTLDAGIDPTSGDWSVDADHLDDGPYTVVAEHDGAAGSTTASVAFTVDTTGPDITLSTPADGDVYGVGDTVSADYSCRDATAVQSCTGTLADGAAIDTSTAGDYTFEVDATDTLGNPSTQTASYHVVDNGGGGGTTFTLTAATGGAGEGRISSDPPGILCGTSEAQCTHDYDDGTDVTLTATAGANSAFDSWTGDCAGTAEATCTVTMDQARSVGAKFTSTGGGGGGLVSPLSVSLDGAGEVVSTPAGIDCGNGHTSCAANFTTGSHVDLAATAADGSVFDHWSGDCSGTSCGLTMSAARSVTATFALASLAITDTESVGVSDTDAVAIQQYGLSVSRDGTGTGSVSSSPAGIVCGALCSNTFDAGSTVTLTPTAEAGSAFDHWSGACTGSGACTVTMDEAQSVTATFALAPIGLTDAESISVSDADALTIVQFTLAVAGNGDGTVTSAPSGISCGSTCSASFDSGSSVTLTATAASGSVFDHWSGDCSGSQATCTVPMDQARSVTATFALSLADSETVTVTDDASPTVGPTATPTATPAHTLRLALPGGGTVSSTPAGVRCTKSCSLPFPAGTVVTLMARPAKGGTFKNWGGACVKTSPCHVTLDTDRTVSATFVFPFDVKVKGRGTVAGTPAKPVAYGTDVTLTAKPKRHARFKQWTGDCSGHHKTCTVTVTTAESVTARFKTKAHKRRKGK